MNLSRHRLLMPVLVIPVLAILGACGATTTSDDSGSAARSSVDPGAAAGTTTDTGASGSGTAPEPAYAAGADGKAADAIPAAQAAAPPAEDRSVIYKGQISLHTTDVDKARFELQKLLDDWDGEVTNEQSDADKEGNTDRQRLELRVPSEHFDAAMNGISGLGTLVDRNRTSEDVTTQVIDNEVRVRSQKASILRIQALLAQATTLNQVISIEQQLSQRQADLDSLEQQQKYLADQTALATINVYLSVPGKGEASSEENGFVAGLKAGWEHLGSSTRALMTAIGVVLPFAAVIALIGTPVWLAARRRRTRTIGAEA